MFNCNSKFSAVYKPPLKTDVQLNQRHAIVNPKHQNESKQPKTKYNSQKSKL